MIETRVTPWRDLVGGPWYPEREHGGTAAYRIWQQYDGMRWFQRHEWRHADGSTEIDKWINGASGWAHGAKTGQTNTTAP